MLQKPDRSAVCCAHKKVETHTNSAYRVMAERDDPAYEVVGQPKSYHHIDTSGL